MNKKTIWITGGSTGIGKALAIKFANMGWNVAISARREGLLKEISEKTGVSINTSLGRMRYALINLRNIIKKKNIILTS